MVSATEDTMTLLRGFASVSGMVFVSRLLGLWRDIIIASVFGAGGVSDAFFTAFRLPNTLRRFTAEGALTQAFVPIYSAQQRRDATQAAKLAGEIATLLLAALLLLSLLCIVFAPYVIVALAPGLEQMALAADLLRVLFFYIVLISLVALFSGILNAHSYFHAAAVAPLFLNIAMIAAALWWTPFFQQPIFALAWGVLLAGVVQLLWLLWHVKRAGLLPSLPRCWQFSASLGQVFHLFWRSALGSSAAQFNLLINLFIASFFTAGSISWLYYADRLMELPAGLLGAALTTVVLPALSAHADKPTEFQELLDNALRLILFLAVPAAAGLAYLALPLVSTLFLHGAFSASDVQMTQLAVLAYAVGVPGLVAVRPLAAAFFARQDAGVPVRAAVAALCLTQLLNVIFIFGLQLAHVGLALSVGLAACANALILYIVLRRRGWFKPQSGWHKFYLQLFAALAVMLLVLFFIVPEDSFWLQATTWQRIGKLTLCLLAAVGAYFSTAYLCGMRPQQFNQRLMPLPSPLTSEETSKK
ncbi:MAG: murein biosynthesis integral membrane protein MurJ [Proteobacteria bacterium]|nr:murein biosynthesis integral membrane protein MurJ [Pseudomonadota bacterium]